MGYSPGVAKRVLHDWATNTFTFSLGWHMSDRGCETKVMVIYLLFTEHAPPALTAYPSLGRAGCVGLGMERPLTFEPGHPNSDPH